MTRFPRSSLHVFQWMLLILLSVSLACSLPGRTPEPNVLPTQPPIPTNTPQPLPPALVESSPPLGAEIPLNSPITLYFNQPMDHSSVEAALSSGGGTGGRLFWANDATLVFTPDAALAPGTDLTLAIAETARAQNGLAMLKPLEIHYRTAGYLRLTQRLPEDSAGPVDPSSAVVASFNRPVVPLGADPASLPVAFTLEPVVEGRGEWANTSTYIFYPDPPMAGGQAYTVQVNPSLTSTDGSPLEVPVPWSFSTALPVLETGEPADGAAGVRLDAAVRLVFNQRMDPASILSNFRLLSPDNQPVAGTAGWDDRFTTFVYTPTALLGRNAAYTVQLDGAALSAGGAALGTAYQAAWTTVPQLEVSSHNVAAGGIKELYNDVAITFSAPIPFEGIEAHVSIDPSLDNITYYLDEDGRTLHIYGEFLPASNYQVLVDSSFVDVWGGSIQAPYQLPFRTGDMYPSLSFPLGLDMLFLTPQDTAVDLQVVNVPQVQFGGGSVSLNDFLKMIAPNGFDLRQNFVPSDARYWDASLNSQTNVMETVSVPVSPDGGTLSPGLYWLRAFTDQQVYAPPVYLVVGNVQLTFKTSLADVLVWAVDLRNQQPVPGAPVVIYDEDGTPLATGTTDADGIFKSPIALQMDPFRTRMAVTGRPGEENFGLALSTWDSGVASYEFNILQDYRAPGQQVYLYTDRPIYRPGQTVYFRAVVREALNGRYSLPVDTATVNLGVFDSVGSKIASLDLGLSAFGAAHGEYTLVSNAAPGYYSLQVGTQTISFQVANYRKPEINLQVDFLAESALYGQNLPAQVNARYFFDAPAGNVPLQWALYARPESFSLPNYLVGTFYQLWLNPRGFIPFGPGYLGNLIAQGQALSDADGLSNLDLPTVASTDLVDSSTRQRYTLEVTMTDESGQPVSARASILVDPAPIYIGLRPDSRSGQPGQPGGYAVQVVDSQGNPAGAHALHAEYSKITFLRQEVDRLGRSPVEPFRLEFSPVGSADFITDDDGKARLSFTPPEAGAYQLAVSGESARTDLMVWISGDSTQAWPELPNQRIELTTDQSVYQSGQTAQVFIPNPFPVETLALLTVERGIVMRHQVLRLPAGGSQVPVELSADDAPNIYVAVTLLSQNELGLPDFRQGYASLDVTPEQQTLQVSLDVQPERAGPGEEVTLTLQARDGQNNPVQAEFSLAVVDSAVLALADPNSAKILEAYYGKQPLGVRTGLALAAYGRRSSLMAGGVGGGGGGPEAISVTRDNFPDTAYWNAVLTTDAAGRAQVTVTLPDNLTTWQVEARGITADSLVGQAQAQIITSKDLLIRPITPRFMVVGDHVRLGAVVQNNTPTDLPVDVSLQANGVLLDSGQPESQQVSVPAGSRSLVTWWVTVQDVLTADLRFTAQAGELRDSLQVANGALPVSRYSATQAFATAGILESAASQLELVSLPQSFAAAAGPADELSIELSPSLAAAVLNALKIRFDISFENPEQAASVFLPNLATYRLLKTFGVQAPETETQFDRELSKALQGILATQRFDGGWSWWQEAESDQAVTAYVLFALTQAQQAGLSVPADALSRANGYLLGTLAPPDSLQENWQLDRFAFIHYVLAEAGAPDQVSLTTLYEKRGQLSAWAQALLALALDKTSPGSPEATVLYSDLQAAAQRSAFGAFWPDTGSNLQNMHSTLSGTAVVIYALAQRDPAAPILADAVRFLMASRRPRGSWASTFDDSWALLAINRYIQGTGELNAGFDFSASLNGEQLASGQAGGDTRLNPVRTSFPAMRLYPAAPNALTIQRSEGPGRLYYTAVLDVSQPVEQVAPLNAGLAVRRSYFQRDQVCAPSECQPIQQAQVGQPVTVRLTLVVPEDAYYVRLEDYIPAGAEVLDTSLKTSQLGLDVVQGVETQQVDPRLPYQGGWGWWLFGGPQVYDDHVGWSARYLAAGTYELTYTLNLLQPGDYRLLPARAWQYYFPDVQGMSGGSLFTILP